MPRKLYGKGVVGSQPNEQAPRADRILGAWLQTDDAGKPQSVTIQYESSGKHIDLEVSFLNAMFLLSALKSIQLDTKTPFPDDPRAPEVEDSGSAHYFAHRFLQMKRPAFARA